MNNSPSDTLRGWQLALMWLGVILIGAATLCAVGIVVVEALP